MDGNQGSVSTAGLGYVVAAPGRAHIATPLAGDLASLANRIDSMCPMGPEVSVSLTRSEGMQHAPANEWCSVHGPAVMKVVFPPQPTDDGVNAFVSAMQGWMEQVDRPYMFLLDLQHVLQVTSVQRRLLADGEAAYEAIERRFNGGQAMVVTSALQRGVLTAFHWISRPVWPSQIVASEAAADAWLEAQWKRVTVDFPDGPTWAGRLTR